MGLLTLGLLHNANAIIGYDCGARSLNITTLSLLDVEPCDIPQTAVNVTETFLHLLQLNEFVKTHVRQCKIMIKRTVYHCGMHSHTSVVSQGQMEFMHEVGNDVCNHLHWTGAIKIGTSAIITGLGPNSTSTRSLTIAGTVDNNGKCAGTEYSDPYGIWSNVVVQGVIELTIQDYYATVNINTNKVNLRSGLACRLSEPGCVDLEGGNTFWDPLPDDNCRFDRYDILYEGLAQKVASGEGEKQQAVYAVTQGDITFALTRKRAYPICGLMIYRTEHPKMFLLESQRGAMPFAQRKISVENLDIFAYVNAKFVYVERHIRTEINRLYYDVVKQNCEIERQVLKTTLSLATQAPDEFAFQLMKGPGYMAVVAGEVAHVIKCIPVEVKLRRTEECYHHLPVSRENDTLFISPRTHILLQTGTQISCNPMVPPMYQFQGAWYKLIPSPTETLAPQKVAPMTKLTWKYTSPGELAISGIYTQADLDNMRENILFPAERAAILNTIARGISGYPTQSQGTSFTHLLDEEALEKISRSAGSKILQSFMAFGTASAGVLGVFTIFAGVKLIADTIVHGYALHTVYGWSIHLLGALWSSLTYLLVHLGQKNPKDEEDSKAETIDEPNTTNTTEPGIYPTLQPLPRNFPLSTTAYTFSAGGKTPEEV